MHWLVYGQTGAGKSSYLKHEAAVRALKRGQRVIVYDPFGDMDWPKDIDITARNDEFFEKKLASAEVFQSNEEFWKVVDKATDALVIYDETGSTDKNDQKLIDLAIMGRHRRLLCVFAAQRPQQINRSVRGQCSHIVVFHLVPKDAEFIADEWGAEVLRESQKLKTLHYIYADRWGRSAKSKINFDKIKQE